MNFKGLINAVSGLFKSLLVKPPTNSTTTFQVQDKDGNIILTVDTASQRVGIGPGAPSQQVGIVSAGPLTASVVNFDNYTSTAGYAPVLQMRHSNSDTLGALAATVADTYLSIFQFWGVDSGNTSFRKALEIEIQQDGNATATSVPGRLTITTTNAAGSNAERFRLDAEGRIGIGTIAPAYYLQVNSDSAGKPGIGGLWTVVSDARIKSDIIPADLARCYEIVKNIPLKYFGWADGVFTESQVKDRNSLGWIAQDVQKEFPKSVNTVPFVKKFPTGEFKEIPTEDMNDKSVIVTEEIIREEIIPDCLDLNGGQMLMAMYGAVQKLMEKVESLESELAILKGKG